jgi:hypothetical protein
MMLMHKSRNDIVTALISGLKTRLKIAPIAPHPKLDLLSSTRYRIKLSKLTSSEDFSQEAVEVYAMLRHLIMDKEKTIAARKLTDAEFDSFGSYAQYLAYQLIPLVQGKVLIPPDQPYRNTGIFRLLGLAGLAHIFTFSWKLPRPHVRIFISAQIRAGLETFHICSSQAAYPEVWMDRRISCYCYYSTPF